MTREHVNEERTELARWSLYRQPTPTKKIKSVGMLTKRITEFFAQCDDIVPPTPSQLALFLGYPSAAALYREIANPIEPKYAEALEAAVDRITDNMTVCQMRVAEKSCDYRGYEAALKRIDLQQDKVAGTAPNGTAGSLIGGNLNIQINVEKREKLNSLIDDSIDAIMGGIEVEPEAVAVKEAKQDAGRT